MEITRCLTISTGHITAQTMQQLEKEPEMNQIQLSVYRKGDFGYWIYCPQNMLTTLNNGKYIPEDLWKCMCLANTNDCEWLCLDSDGQEIADLPLYEW